MQTEQEHNQTNKKIVVNTDAKLDFILEYLFKFDCGPQDTIISEKSLITSAIFTSDEFPELRDKLVADGYIEKDPYLKLTFKGKMFWDDTKGGYVKQKKDREARLSYQIFTKNSLLIAGILAGIYYLKEICLWAYHYICNCN